MKKGLIAASAECSVCKKAMHLMKKSSSDGYTWECRKRGANGHRMKRSVRKNRWSKDTLLASIKSNIKEGTIISDCWKSYDCLEDEENHLPVNHKMYFKDPETGAYTNSIDGSWRAIKKSLGGTRRCQNQFDSYLAEFMWRKLKRPSNLNDLFTSLL
ncbi:putative transposase-like protein [Trichonephila clavipes]|nr:putative transposase-like protein [Trichonephila clavipes]